MFVSSCYTLLSQVEDIVDTGNTLSCVISHMQSKGALSVSVCAFLDKPARRKSHFELVGEGKFYRGFEARFFILFKIEKVNGVCFLCNK